VVGVPDHAFHGGSEELEAKELKMKNNMNEELEAKELKMKNHTNEEVSWDLPPSNTQ
jgi:hypothetical protein